MRPYEIHQFRDGRINYDIYYARPVSLLSCNMYRFCRQAVSLKSALIVVVAVAALVFMASGTTHRGACAICAPVKISLLGK